MTRFRFSIASLMGVVVIVALWCAAVRDTTGIWSAVALILAIAVLCFAVVGSILARANMRLFWIGFAVFGWGFLFAGSFGLYGFPRVEGPWQLVIDHFNLSDEKGLSTWVLAYVTLTICAAFTGGALSRYVYSAGPEPGDDSASSHPIAPTTPRRALLVAAIIVLIVLVLGIVAAVMQHVTQPDADTETLPPPAVPVHDSDKAGADLMGHDLHPSLPLSGQKLAKSAKGKASSVRKDPLL